MKAALRIGCLASLLLAAGTAHADVSLRSAMQLEIALKSSPPCCVIDGRHAAQRQHAPLPEALPYRPGMTINPTAAVVVVADSDSEAKRIGAELGKAHPDKTIIAVKGGVPTWKSVLAALDKPASDVAGAPTGGINFVIPKNTCESGETLQKLRSQAK
jgi:hypothetical protein